MTNRFQKHGRRTGAHLRKQIENLLKKLTLVDASGKVLSQRSTASDF
jgi:hypothetical protein